VIACFALCESRLRKIRLFLYVKYALTWLAREDHGINSTSSMARRFHCWSENFDAWRRAGIMCSASEESTDL
jgi:hypothetical protein